MECRYRQIGRRPFDIERERDVATKTFLSGKQFYNLCEQLRALTDFLDKERPSRDVAARTLAKKLGFHVSVAHLDRATEATGVTWAVHRKAGGGGHKKTLALRAVVDAVLALFADLGKVPPLSLLVARQDLGQAGKTPEPTPA